MFANGVNGEKRWRTWRELRCRHDTLSRLKSPVYSTVLTIGDACSATTNYRRHFDAIHDADDPEGRNGEVDTKVFHGQPVRRAVSQ